MRDALAGFDAATIATIHQFCQLVLKSLGVAGDTDAGVTLVESLDELVAEIVDDLYLAHFGQERDDPVLTYRDALRLAREVVKNPSTELRPLDPEPDSRAAVCLGLRKLLLPSWKHASVGGACSATTTCSAGWPPRWTPTTPPPGRGCISAGPS